MSSISNNIRPTKYPVDPDAQAELLDQAVAAGRLGKQDTLVSGTNIKTINGSSLLGEGNLTVTASGGGPQVIAKKAMVSHTGTAISGNAMIASEDISAHISTNTYYHISVMVRKTSGASSSSAFRLYVNSSASLTGATLIGTMVSVTSVNNIANNTYNFATDSSGNMYVVAAGGALSSNYVQSGGTVITIPSPCYLIWASQTPNGDTIVLLNSTVTKYA